MPRVIWNTVTHASYGKSARTGSTARMWWSMLILGIKRSARQVSLAERAVEGVLRTALGLWLCVMSVLVAYHVQPIGRALLGLPASVYVPATAWILTCVVGGVLHNAAFQLPATAMPLLLTVPVSRRAIAVVALATKAAHPSNFIIGVFLVVLWWFNIYTLQPLLEALAWLVAAILLYLSSWLLGVAVRTRNVQTTEPLLALVWATTISGSVLTSLYLVSYSGRWSILVTVVLASLASMMVLRRIEAVLQVDARDATARVVGSSPDVVGRDMSSQSRNVPPGGVNDGFFLRPRARCWAQDARLQQAWAVRRRAPWSGRFKASGGLASRDRRRGQALAGWTPTRTGLDTAAPMACSSH